VHAGTAFDPEDLGEIVRVHAESFPPPEVKPRNVGAGIGRDDVVP
jgi:hypothetical protein